MILVDFYKMKMLLSVKEIIGKMTSIFSKRCISIEKVPIIETIGDFRVHFLFKWDMNPNYRTAHGMSAK